VTNESVIDDREHGYCVAIPSTGPSGRAVSIQTGVRRGAHVRHAETEDQHEIYFEVTAYPTQIDHRELAAEQQAFLRDHSSDGDVTAPRAGHVGRLDGTMFEFAGTLQGRFKRRRFLFVDAGARTYRVVFDPTSAPNTVVLDSLVFVS
jgi:hypothetical protein